MTQQQQIMTEMRRAGFTYEQIGKELGISKQRVHFLIGPQARRVDSDVEKIVYQGVYDLFKGDPQMSFPRFTRIFYGGAYVNRSQVVRIKRFCTGQTDSLLSIEQINSVCEYIGKPYEEIFRRRTKNCEEHPEEQPSA